MIVDVANLDLTALRCFIFFNLAAIGLANKYGIRCNVEDYRCNIRTGSKFLFLATTCNEDITDEIFCDVDAFIKWAKKTTLYNDFIDCAVSDPTSFTCALALTDADSSCASNLTINIIQ